MKPELKKLLILNAPYLLFVYLFDKIGQAVRLSPGTDLSGKVLSLADGFSAAFTNPLPSLAPMDLLIGIVEMCIRDRHMPEIAGFGDARIWRSRTVR